MIRLLETAPQFIVVAGKPQRGGMFVESCPTCRPYRAYEEWGIFIGFYKHAAPPELIPKLRTSNNVLPN
jgi:hypothetical protein